MCIFGHNDGMVVTQCTQELLFCPHNIGLHLASLIFIHLVRSTSVFCQSTYILTDVSTMAAEGIRHSLLALDKLDVQLFDNVEFDGTVIVARLIPRLFGKMLLQILRLELPSMSRQDLITHEAQLILRETSQISGVQQTMGQLVADRLFFQITLEGKAVLQIVRSKRHLPHSIPIGLADSQEIHTVLTDILNTPAYLCTQRCSLFLRTSEDILTVLSFYFRQMESEASFMLADTFHRYGITLHLSGIEYGTVEPIRTILNGLCLYTTEGAQTHHH